MIEKLKVYKKVNWFQIFLIIQRYFNANNNKRMTISKKGKMMATIFVFLIVMTEVATMRFSVEIE